MIVDQMIVLLAYLIGSISVGYILVRIVKQVDVRDSFSGSTGGRNVGRILGKGGFIATVIGDILKGAAAVIIAQNYSSSERVLLLSAIFVVIGHIWPVFINFRGGKGLSAALGTVLVFDYRIALLYLILGLLFIGITRRITFSGLLALAFLPVYSFLLGHSYQAILAFFFIAVIILYAHRTIIASLLSRNNLWFRRSHRSENG